jgi:heme-degrading monooxygenase HmoA
VTAVEGERSAFSRKFQASVFARMHTLQTTPEVHDRGLELLDELLPWLGENKGFRGLLRLAALDRSKTVVITFWADEAAMTETAESGEGIGALAAEAVGSKRIALEDYEVTFFDADLERSTSHQ